MARLILVCGPIGAGKTTYSRSLCDEIGAVQFSIDAWMQTLYSKDMTTMDYEWMLERVHRCYEQIWQVSQQILFRTGKVVLDLGFTTVAQRDLFRRWAEPLAVDVEVHYLDAPKALRYERIKKRNAEKDPAVYAFEVTDMMFNFMEPKFEVPNESELKHGCKINVAD